MKNSVVWNNTQGVNFVFSDYFNISNCNITNNLNGDVNISDANSNHNFLWNNTFDINTSMKDAAVDNDWNLSTGGNIWLFFDEPSEGCFDLNHDGICDDANVSIPGGGGAYDFLPLYNGPVALQCGDSISSDTTLNSNLTCNGTALYIVADNVELYCNNNYVRGNGTSPGIKVNTSNVNITNCKVFEFAEGILADPGTGLSINNTIFAN